ncbi:MAG: low molecular weight phosphatase family protein [Halobacteriales archaeon]|nr:low molecular weight phosphatase family protein [Halobacteriales archaeon]
MVETPVRIAFMCVQNAGRSQMATAFAERERTDRGLEETVEILTGGTHPADHVHEEVIAVMDELGIDLSDRQPQAITTAQLESCDYVATMGCSTLDLDADASDVEVDDWALDDPDGQSLDRVREIREEIRERVNNLFDDLEREVTGSV